MGNVVGVDFNSKRELARSKAISDHLLLDSRREFKVAKVLLLGKDEDNIFMRQLQVLYGVQWGDLSADERNAKRQDVFRAVVVNMASLLDVAEGNEVVDEPLKHRLNDERNRCIHGSLVELDNELITCLSRLWDNQAIQAALTEMRNGRGLETATALEYYMENPGRVLNTGLVVTDADAVHALMPRGSREGLVSLDYTMHQVRHRLYDGRSLRGEQRKWMHMFENVTAFFYLVPINQFDETLYEDPSTNVVSESMMRFESLVNSVYLKHAHPIVFFTNIALFREKLQIKPISVIDNDNPYLNRWTDFEGFGAAPETLVEADEAFHTAIAYFKGKFNQLLHDPSYKAVISYTVELRDLDNVNMVLHAVKDVILRVQTGGPGFWLM